MPPKEVKIESNSDDTGPGPGTYRTPSEFGTYLSSKAADREASENKGVNGNK